ncbi:zinc-dependent alcohol dehydrogenase family protein [Chitinimonas naiadis]
MKAMLALEQGGPDVLTLSELPIPVPGPGQLRVRVMATGINPIDIKVRKVRLPMTPTHFPALLQTDFAGTVDALGAGVADFLVGDEVFGFSGGFRGPQSDVPGALAEYTLVDAALVARKPARLSFREAAALPLVAVTAWKALFEKTRVQPTSKVLIIGAAGGVGSIAVQLASAAGAYVVAITRSAESAAYAQQCGANACVDLTQTSPQALMDAHTGGQGFDVIFDTVGGASLDAAFQMIKPAGDVVTIVGAATHNLAPLYLRGANLHTVLVLIPIMFGHDKAGQGKILTSIAQLADAGRVRPRLDTARFTLERAAEAHARFESGKAQGKVVVDVSLQNGS